jgi:hypothetical protein
MHHFDLHYDIVRMRHDELVHQATHPHPGGAKEPRRRWFGRRRRPNGPPRRPSVLERHLVAVPPPRHAAADHDTQVA